MQNLVNTFKTKAYFECIIIADNVTVVKALLKQSHNIGKKAYTSGITTYIYKITNM